MGGMAGLLSLTSTTWTLTVAVLLSGGFPLSAACRTNLQKKRKKKKGKEIQYNMNLLFRSVHQYYFY